MKYHYIFYAVNLLTKECFIYGTKYLGPTNYRGSRLKYQRINQGFEGIDKPVSRQWSYQHTNQQDQLQEFLGTDWKVLSQWETMQACSDSLHLN